MLHIKDTLSRKGPQASSDWERGSIATQNLQILLRDRKDLFKLMFFLNCPGDCLCYISEDYLQTCEHSVLFTW